MTHQSFQKKQFVLLPFLIVLFTLTMPSGLLGQADEYVPPQKLDGSRANQAPQDVTGAPSGDQSPMSLGSGSSDNAATLFEQLMKEMDSLIPGKLSENPERKTLVENAIKQFQNRKAKQTVEILNQLSKADAQFPPTDLLLAALSFVVKDQKTGLLLLERAAAKKPESIGIYSAFARLAINEARIADATVHLEKMNRLMAGLPAASKDFYTAQYLDGMIDVAMRQQRYADAKQLLAKQMTKLPDRPKVLMIAAELEFREDKIDKSLALLKQLKSKFAPSRVPESILASWYQRSGKKAESDKWLKVAAKKYPKDARVQLEYASWAINSGNFNQATEAIKSSEKVNKETPFSKNLKAKIAFASGSYVVAEFHFEQLALATPSNFDASNMHALSLIESTDEAKRNRALKIAITNYQSLPKSMIAQAALGYIQLRLGNLEQAKVALASSAKSQRGVSPEIDFFVASVLSEMGEKEKSRGVLQIALRHQGFFLYRTPAKKMLAELGGPLPEKAKPVAGSGELPVPKKK